MAEDSLVESTRPRNVSERPMPTTSAIFFSATLVFYALAWHFIRQMAPFRLSLGPYWNTGFGGDISARYRF
jgi:hypothetical protein